jgi:hypothetical protein
MKRLLLSAILALPLIAQGPVLQSGNVSISWTITDPSVAAGLTGTITAAKNPYLTIFLATTSTSTDRFDVVLKYSLPGDDSDPSADHPRRIKRTVQRSYTWTGWTSEIFLTGQAKILSIEIEERSAPVTFRANQN